jgi:RNA polymerase sigma factor (sigma-70 family)
MRTDDRERLFRTVYEQSRPRLLAYALRRTASPADAADVVAETFVTAWRRLDALPEGEASLLWLYATCRRVIANYSRRAKRRVELVQEIGAQLRTVVSDPLDLGVEALMAARSLSRLADDDREILMLVSWEGLTSAGVARVLGCSPTAARIRLHRARARLVREMEQVGLVTKQEPSSGHSSQRERVPREA